MPLSLKKGDLFFVLADRRQDAMDAKRTYRQMKVFRVTPQTIIARSLHGTEHRFWRNDRREIGDRSQWMTLETPRPDIFEVDPRDEGRSW